MHNIGFRLCHTVLKNERGCNINDVKPHTVLIQIGDALFQEEEEGLLFN